MSIMLSTSSTKQNTLIEGMVNQVWDTSGNREGGDGDVGERNTIILLDGVHTEANIVTIIRNGFNMGVTKIYVCPSDRLHKHTGKYAELVDSAYRYTQAFIDGITTTLNSNCGLHETRKGNTYTYYLLTAHEVNPGGNDNKQSITVEFNRKPIEIIQCYSSKNYMTCILENDFENSKNIIDDESAALTTYTSKSRKTSSNNPAKSISIHAGITAQNGLYIFGSEHAGVSDKVKNFMKSNIDERTDKNCCALYIPTVLREVKNSKNKVIASNSYNVAEAVNYVSFIRHLFTKPGSTNSPTPALSSGVGGIANSPTPA